MDDSKIEIFLSSKEAYQNEYNKKRLSSSLSDYILEESKFISPKKKINLIIKTKFELENEEKEELVDMIRNNYGTDVSELIMVSKKLKKLDLIIFIMGVIALLVYFLIPTKFVASEVILIIGWVLIWESTYNFIFRGAGNQLKILRRKQIINGKITFEKDMD
ncbi:MAG: hypothetical protein U0M66_02910 [Bacilli bacterium]|nr:hypothetical protein [Bacilli bacterium]